MVFKLGFSIIHDLSKKHIVYCWHIYKYTLAVKTNTELIPIQHFVLKHYKILIYNEDNYHCGDDF